MNIHRSRSAALTSRFSAAGAFGALAFAAALLSSPLSASAASSIPSATLPPCAVSGGVSVVLATASPKGDLSPQCVPQAGQVLVIITNAAPTTGPTIATNPAPTNSLVPTSTLFPNTTLAPTTTPVQFDMNLVTTDTRIDSYAKRQAIRDTYRGQIDETTFNDELGDGVPLDQVLADAMAAYNQKHP